MFFMFHLFDDRFIQFGVTVGSLDVPSMPITRVLFWPFQNSPYLWTLVRIASSKVFFLLLLALCDSMNVWLVLLWQLVITLGIVIRDAVLLLLPHLWLIVKKQVVTHLTFHFHPHRLPWNLLHHLQWILLFLCLLTQL